MLRPFFFLKLKPGNSLLFNEVSALSLGYERNFRKESFSTIDSRGVGYDYDSVMHYGSFFFTKEKGKKTIKTKKRGASIGQRVGLSDMDTEQANLLYNCDGKQASLE